MVYSKRVNKTKPCQQNSIFFSLMCLIPLAYIHYLNIEVIQIYYFLKFLSSPFYALVIFYIYANGQIITVAHVYWLPCLCNLLREHIPVHVLNVTLNSRLMKRFMPLEICLSCCSDFDIQSTLRHFFSQAAENKNCLLNHFWQIKVLLH